MALKLTLNPTTAKLDLIQNVSSYAKLAFKTIAVAGQPNVVADAKDDTLTLVAGSNVTITTDDSADSVTIASAIPDGDKGDIKVRSGGTAWTVDNKAVTYDKIQDVSATDRILGRATTGSGVIEEITCTSAARSILDDTSIANIRTTLGVGTGSSPQFSAVNVGHASDTTISRVSAGVIAVEGVTIVPNATHTGDVTGATALAIDKTAITGKSAVTAVGTDYVLISDTSDSGNLKKALASDLAGPAGTDEKVKYDVSDPSAGYIADKFVAGTGISLAEGTGANENKLVITNSVSGLSDGDKGDITVSGSGATWTIDNKAVTLAKMDDMATASLIYRKTAGSGAPEVNSLATLKTDLGLTGTNSGDQDLSGLVAKATYDANTILKADTDNTPAALTVGEQTIVGRATGGSIAALSIDSDLSSTSANDDTVPSAKATKTALDTKQATLVSGTNIKTVNSTTLLGAGDISITPNATHTGEVTGSTTLTVDKTAITGKTAVTAVGTDYILISDTSDSGNLKKALASDFGGGTGTSDHAALTNLNWDDADHTIDVDVDFATFKAVAMACDNGATLPTSPTPVNGQWFRFITTGRDILFQYSSTASAWIPIYSFANITYYVDGSSGSDTQQKGTGTGSDAFATINYALSQIPNSKAPNTFATVNIAAGTYAESVVIDTSYVTLQGAAFSSASLSLTCDSWTKGGTTSSGGPSPDILVDTGAFTGVDYTGYFWTKDDTTFYPIIWNDNNTLWIADNSITSCTTYKIYPPPTTVIDKASSTAAPLVVSPLLREVNINNIRLTNTGTGTTFTIGSASSVGMSNVHSQGGNVANGSLVNGVLTFSKSYIYESYANRYVMTITQGRMVGANSVFHAYGSGGICLRQNQLGLSFGNPSFFRGAAGTTRGLVLNQGGTTLFGQWFFNFATAVWTDLSGLLVFENVLYATFNTCTRGIESPRGAWNSTLSIKDDTITSRATIGYDSVADLAYMNYGSSTTNNDITVNDASKVGIGMEATEKLEVAGNVSIPSDSNGLLVGASKDMKISYDGTDGKIETDIVAPSDLRIDCGTAKTIVLHEPTWRTNSKEYGEWINDTESPLTWNISGFAGGAVGYYSSDSTDLGAWHFDIQMPEDYKEGTTIYWYVKFTTGDIVEADDTIRFNMAISHARKDSTYANDSLDPRYTCPEGGVAAWTHLRTDEDTYSLSGEFNISTNFNVRVDVSGDSTYEKLIIPLSVGYWYEVDTPGGARTKGAK